MQQLQSDIAYAIISRMRIVLDTNILVGALLRNGGASREILRLCLEQHITPLIGTALFTEMEDVLSRPDLFKKCRIDATERNELFRAFLSCTESSDGGMRRARGAGGRWPSTQWTTST